MKNILCFGDSNTYGYNPKNGSRYNVNTRWSGRLGNYHNVEEAGCNNRTAFCINPGGDNLTGIKVIPKYLKRNFDFLIIQIGINDLQTNYNASLKDFETGMNKFFYIINDYCPNSNVIILSPCEIQENILNSNFKFLFDEQSIEKSKKIFPIYEKIAQQHKYQLLDLNKITEVSKLDGLHYEASQHEIISKTILNLL